METLEQIRDRLLARFPSAQVTLVTNPGAAAEHSLLFDAASARDLALFLRDDSALAFDYCSNATGIDWPDKEITDVTKTSVPDPAGGPAKIVEQKTTRKEPGYLEAVYHLYSMAKKHGPIVIRMRTANRTDQVTLPSFTPVWRSCDFQEREIFDLYGIVFTGHPDLRRLLMWDEFKDHPMRKDYVEPDDYEWEPTAHGDVLERAKAHLPSSVAGVTDTGYKNFHDGGQAMNPPLSALDSQLSTNGANAPFSSAPGPIVRAVHDQFHGDLLEVSMGPQHPSTHGVFRMVATLDGEQIVKLKPVFGYLHRNHEKIAENTTYLGSMPYTDRLDYLCSMSTNWAYALAVEKLAGQTVPDRAQYLRIIMAELTRLVNHSCLVGFLFNDLGTSFTPLLYAFREREKILDLFESLSGSRMMCNYQRFGGCRVDPSPEWLKAASALVDNFPRFLDEYETMLTGNEIMLARTQGIGRLDSKHAINAGITGPVLRACGVDYDVRKVDAYGFYPRFNFRVPLGAHGDTYDRYMMRILEMRESVKILQQAFKELPAGPIMDPKAKIRGFRPKAGEAYGRHEGPKGELGFYLISDGSPNPYRYRVRPPSLINLTLLEEMCLGHTIADSVVILGSIDIVLGEVDR